MHRSRTTMRLSRFWISATPALMAAAAGMWLATPAWAEPFFFSAGNADGLLGALSQPAAGERLETETADDFILAGTTSIAQATVVGLIPAGSALANIRNVEVEIYHVFPKDSVDPPANNVPARANSPSDVEIESATREARLGTLTFAASLLDETFSAQNTVVDGINPAPANMTQGEGPASGAAVQIILTFTPPIILPADHYFFRPEVEVTDGDFLYLSAPRPITAPGTPFMGDLQAWIRNSDLKPDWLRIGTDIIGGTPVQTFNMAFSLTGEATPAAATPTPTATSQPTATPTDPPSNSAGGGCSIGAAPSEHGRAFAFLLMPAAALWCLRRRRA